MELVITVTIIAALVLIGATMLSTNNMDATRDGAYDVVDVMRRARYMAARENRAVVVQVLEHDTVLGGGGTTRGLVSAYLGVDTTCPQVLPMGPTPFAEADFGLVGAEPGAGIARILPAALAGEEPTDGLCFRPNGRILSNTTGAPVPGATPTDMAGNANLWVQWAPLREVGGELEVPVVEVEIPFNGLVTVPQRRRE